MSDVITREKVTKIKQRGSCELTIKVKREQKHAYLVITVFCDANNKRQVMEGGVNVTRNGMAGRVYIPRGS